jgi:drug/metabolite transporter (DMT)-like permease
MFFYRYLPILLYLPSTSFAAVYLKLSFEHVSPYMVTFSTFILCWILFLIQNRARLGELTRTMGREPAAFFKINLYTFLSWIGAFACIQLLTGSVELLVFMSAIPFTSVLAGGEWPRIGRGTRMMVIAIFFCSLAVVLLHPTMQNYPAERQLLGLVIGIAAGGFGALYMVLSGRVQKTMVLSSVDMICLRLPMLVAATFLLSIPELGFLLSGDFLLKAAFLSLVAVVIPAYTLQLSIVRLGAVPTSVLMPLVPVFALFFEWGANIPLTVAAILAMTLQCVAIMWVSFALARARQAAAKTRVPASAGQDAVKAEPARP